MSNYHPLTEQEAIQIAKSLNSFFNKDAVLTSTEIGDGNLNLVFHIKDEQEKKGIILKQALPYAKVVGESWPLSLDRARIESEKLILEGTLAPGLVPTVYKYDSELALTIMEDLSDHVIMRRGLMDGNLYPLFAEHISTFMAQTLFFTSDLGMNQQEKKQQVKNFINPDLCKITEDLIFDDPYTISANNNYEATLEDYARQLREDEQLHLEVALLREKFLTKAQALLHGDLHTGSVFVTSSSTKVIDPEFAYYGPIGFDIGAVFANLLFHYCSSETWHGQTNQQVAKDYVVDSIRSIWHLFNDKFLALWEAHGVDRLANSTPAYKSHYMLSLLQDAAGFTGTKMVRRIVGLSHVADIDKIEDDSARLRAQQQALNIGTTLIKQNRHISSIEELIDIVLSN